MARTKPVIIPDMDPSETPAIDPVVYQTMGEENIFKMLEDFYRELEKSEIRSMFAEDMIAASRRSAAFYVQLLGGPPLYIEKYGPPMMRKRHFPFEIDEPKRQIWVKCFYSILEGAEEKYNFPPEHLPVFKDFIEKFSRWMVNTAS